MIKISQLVFLILILNFTGFSQKRNDLREWGLRGKVHQVNSYNIYPRPSTDQPNAAIRSLSYISVFNRKGNLRVQFEFSGDGKDCFYKKTVYSYDQKNKKKATVLYQSDKGETFCIKSPPLFQENQPENIDGKVSLVEKTIYEYDRTGRISREMVFDHENKILRQANYTYNRRGEHTRYTITQQKHYFFNFKNTLDRRMFYSDNGKTEETYTYEDGKLVDKAIDYTDNQKRSLGGAHYKLVTDTQNNVVTELISTREKSFYDGNKELFSWTFYNNKGALQQQLYILNENDNELMRLEYSRRSELETTNAGSIERSTHYRFDPANPEINARLKYILKFDECVESNDWIPTGFETRFYKFNSLGNTTKFTIVQQDTHNKENKSIYENETEFIYYK